jgi:co-chaperonin GroES (HSP10)
MKPLGKRLYCKEIVETTTKSGIIIEQPTDKAKKYQVLAVGDGIDDIKVDDIVYTNKYVGSEFDGNMVINYNDVLGKE